MKAFRLVELAAAGSLLASCALVFALLFVAVGGLLGSGSSAAPGGSDAAAGVPGVQGGQPAASEAAGSRSVGGAPVAELGVAAVEAADRARGYDPGVVLATLASGVTPAEARSALAANEGTRGWAVRSGGGSRIEIALPQGVPVSRAVRILSESDAVAAAQPNYLYGIQDTSSASASELMAQGLTNDPYVVDGKLWALASIHAYEAWDMVHANRSVTVAVLDDGFNVNHEDLRDNVVAPFDAFKYSYSRGSEPTQAARDVAGGRGHGTHVAGIVAGTANNARGVAGISYNARVMPVKVFNDLTNTVSTATLLGAFDYVLDNAERYNVRVINMSLGSGRPSLSWNDLDLQLKAKIDEAYARGIVTVVAACNEGSSHTVGYTPPFYCFPGDLDNVVTVISLKRDSTGGVLREDKSNYNAYGQTTKNISAPGNLIWSTYESGDASYGRLSGTSMAAPYVAGTLALMFAADPTLAARTSAATSTAISRLYSSATDVQYSNTREQAGVGWDAYTGVGEVNAAAAVAASAVAVSGKDALQVGKTAQLALAPAQAGAWTWSSSDESVASVSASGVVTGRAAGTAVVTATNAEQTRFAVKTVAVYDPVVSGPDAVPAGKKATYSVPAVPIGSYAWSTSDSSIATINAAGVLSAHAAGTVTVTVRLASDASVTRSKTVVVTGSAGASSSGKVAQLVQVSVAKKAVKYAKLKKKARTLSPITVSGAQGAVSFTKVSGNAGAAVNAATGKITLKRGLRRGTYKVKVRVDCAGTARFAPATKTLIATLVVK